MDDNRKKEYESFQEWCLRTYGEGTKSKTIRLPKYKKILSSLRGEIPKSAESSKFRFWVKTKSFRLVDGMLYVPTSTGGPLRRVAVVEDFYDIIYSVHVGQGARFGNHAGQKRTYRAVSERFAFLPREAVTRFLLGCSDCQRRLDTDPTTTPLNRRTVGGSTTVVNCPSEDYAPINLTTRHCVIRLTVPREMRSSTPDPTICRRRRKRSSSDDDDIDISPVSTEEDSPLICVPDPKDLRISPEIDNEEYNGSKNGEVKEERDDWYGLSNKKPCTPQSRDLSSPLHETGSVHDETSSSGNKDEDDDEDDSDDLKSTPHDPERLKAFNMFVRLFVDENLDRIVPISKQPKEKIQAIIDSCNRQFPEFGERARKRIRTYLKSCRRNKRSRDSSFEAARPTPAHLTSAQAEQILASACENEAHNAKRMRLGLEPVSQPMPVLPGVDSRAPMTEAFSPANLCAETQKTTPSVGQQTNNLLGNSTMEKQPRTPEQRTANITSGISSLYRNVPEGPGRPLEPTDLSLRPRLSLHEITSVRRLVAGYRESAAFLLRSADELEQLLLHQ